MINDCRGIYKKLNSMNDKEYIENLLIFNTSLVIAGSKPAATVNIVKSENYLKWVNYGITFIKSINLDYIELRENENSVILLIYNKELLEENLFTDNNKKFLMSLGYIDSTNIINWLSMLKRRYELYHCPHELGIFLGFPTDDVKDFIECNEKKCLLCGYWKVYNNLSIAKIVFNRYDEIKKHTIESIYRESLSPLDIVMNIKETFFN